MMRPESHSFLFLIAPFSGIEVFMRSLEPFIRAKPDLKSRWVYLEWSDTRWPARIPLVSRNWTLRSGLIARSEIRRAEREGFVFDAALSNSIAPMALLGGFRKRVPVVLSIDVTPTLLERYSEWYHDRPSGGDSLWERAKERTTRRIYSDAAYLLPWSAYVKDSLINDYHVKEERIAVVFPGINLRVWDGGRASPSPARVEGRRVSILFVGADFKRKGGEMVLRAAQRNEFRSCDFHFVTRSFAGPRGDNIFVHEGFEANTGGLIDLYRSADVAVLPTRADFSPFAVSEAMAMGLPVIATRVGGIPELVSDGRSGYLIRPEDEEEFLARLRALVTDADLRKALGSAGRKIAEDRFDIARNSEVILEFLVKAASGSSPEATGNVEALRPHLAGS